MVAIEWEEWDFFVSFTAADEQDARWITDVLESAGYRVLFQHHQFVPGTSFPNLMEEGANRARRTIGVLSPTALEQPMVQREWLSSIVVDPSGADRKLILVEVVPTPHLVGVLAATVRIRLVGLALQDARRTLLDGVAAAVSGRRAPQPTVPSWLADRVVSARLPIPVAPRQVVKRPGIGAAVRERIAGGAIVGIVGPAGAGKSTAALSVAADERIRERFDDRVAWVDVGRHPDISLCRDRLAEALGGGVAGGTGLDELRRIAASRSNLVVLDDVWNAEHLAELDVAVGGTACLVTTRDRAVLPWRADVQDVGLVDDATARRILSAWAATAPEDLPDAAGRVIQRCGGLALALAAAGGLVRSGLDWPDVATKLDAADVGELHLRMPDYPHPTLLRALSVGVADLTPDLRERLRVMAVLQSGADVPIEVCGLLWDDDEATARSTLTQLSDRSLLAYDHRSATVRVHDLLLRSLMTEMDEGLLHANQVRFAQALLAVLQRPDPSAAGTGALARYALRNVVDLLVDAQRPDLVHDLLAESVELLDEAGATRSENLWFHVNTRTGGVGGYLRDLDVARELAERATDEAVTRRTTTLGVAHELRYLLHRASVTALSSALPSWIPAHLVRRGMWPVERAVAHVAAMSSGRPHAQAALLDLVEEEERARLAVAILESPHVGSSELSGYLGRAIRPYVTDAQWKHRLAELVRAARRLPLTWNLVDLAELYDGAEREALLREALAKARDRPTESLDADGLGAARALIALARCASDGQTVGEALRAAWALPAGATRAEALLDLADLVGGLRRQRLVRHARTEALADHRNPVSRHVVLARLLERSAGRPRREVLEALIADACTDPTQDYTGILTTLAAAADAAQFARVTAAVTGIVDPADRLEAQIKLVAGAQGLRREELFLDAMRGAERIVATTPKERERQTSLLARLAASMPDERTDGLLRRVVALSTQISDQADLAPWRAALAVHLPEELAEVVRATALADARGSDAKVQQVARLLPEPARTGELKSLLDKALAQPRAFDRAIALRDLADDLPTPLASRAAVAVRQLLGTEGDSMSEIGIDVAAHAAARLLPHLPASARADLLPALVRQHIMWPESLERFGPQMSFEEVDVLLRTARASFNELGVQMLAASLLPYIPVNRRGELVPAVRAAADAAPPAIRSRMMGGLARAIPGPEGAQFRHAALALARHGGRPNDVQTFIAVAEAIHLTRRAAVLAEARALAGRNVTTGNLGLAVDVARAADHLLDAAWPEYWRPLLDAAAAEDRSSLARVAAAATDAVHRLGGPTAVGAVATAIDDVVRWWP